MKKHMIAAAAFVLALSGAALAQPLLSDAPHRLPLEISFYGGFSLSQIKGTTNYQDQWGWNLLRNVNEQTAIATSAKTGYAAGGELAFYFTPGFGIQALFSYAKMDVPNSAVCNFAWTWTDGTSYSQTATWPGTGSFSSTPLSLDLIGRVSMGRLDGTFSAGVTLFMNSFTQSSSFGYGITTITTNSDGTYTQYIDALRVGLMIPTSAMKKNIVGANFGAGLTWMLSDTIGVRADARYYYCPAQTLSWSFVLGTYSGVFFGDIQNEPFDNIDVQLLQQTSNTFTMRVNPSFIHLTLGLVFSFGGGR
jgi:hypothetical protein